MKIWLSAIAAIVMLAFSIHSTSAEQRLALVIGNEKYGKDVGGYLKNPPYDIVLVGGALREIGFDVVSQSNLKRAEMTHEMDEFIARLSRGGPSAIGFFYYAGHGVSRPSDRNNYLIPVDVTDTQDPYFWQNAVPLERFLSDLSTRAPNAAVFVVFDACRNELHLPERSLARGFKAEEQKSGLFIAFSTSPNASASDRGTNGGPYARALASELRRKGQDHLHLFSSVKEQVYVATNKAQLPWQSDGLIPPAVYLADREPTQYPDATRPPPSVKPAIAKAPFEIRTDVKAPFQIRTKVEAIPPKIGEAKASELDGYWGTLEIATSIGDCEATCARFPKCKIFSYNKSRQSCYMYSNATFAPNSNFDSGIRK
jgi:hypothetical protein